MTNTTASDTTSITKPASRVMFGGVLALAGGLISNIIVAYIYGAGSSMDAYLTAMVIPTYIQIVFFSSLAFVVIPVFIEAESNKRSDDAWALVGTFFWITSIVLLLVSVLGSIFSRSIIGLVAPGFQGGKVTLASNMLAILMFSTPFTGLSILTVGIQNARHHFFWPSVAPAVGSLVNIVTLLLLSGFIGPLALCWGYLLSIITQAGFSVIPVVRHGWKKILPLNDEHVRNIGKAMLPLIVFGLFTCISPVAVRYFSSGLPDGQIAYMGYANKISNIFVIFLASGIAASIFPSMARAFAQDGLPGLSKKNHFGLRLSFAVALPAVMVVAAVDIPLIRIFFERGEFTEADTIGVSQILFAFLVGDVLFRMVGNIFERGFYTLKNTVTPPLISSVFVIIFIATAHLVVTRWGYVGLVWANVARQGFDITTAGIVLFRKFPKEQSEHLTGSILSYLLAACASFLCGRLVLSSVSFIPAFIQLILGGLCSGGVYLALLYFIDKPMLTSIFELFDVRSFLGKFQIGINWLTQRKPWPNERSQQ
ncbi:MAG TPA: lipid II flippase MurJ [Anaerolineales bacterium]|nr:lipid II flippase MurJ [Anaerolineales bacterium]